MCEKNYLLLMVQKSGVYQLRLVVYPIRFKVLYIPGGAGFLPATVSFGSDWFIYTYVYIYNNIWVCFLAFWRVFGLVKYDIYIIHRRLVWKVGSIHICAGFLLPCTEWFGIKIPSRLRRFCSPIDWISWNQLVGSQWLHQEIVILLTWWALNVWLSV